MSQDVYAKYQISDCGNNLNPLHFTLTLCGKILDFSRSFAAQKHTKPLLCSYVTTALPWGGLLGPGCDVSWASAEFLSASIKGAAATAGLWLLYSRVCAATLHLLAVLSRHPTLIKGVYTGHPIQCDNGPGSDSDLEPNTS